MSGLTVRCKVDFATRRHQTADVGPIARPVAEVGEVAKAAPGIAHGGTSRPVSRVARMLALLLGLAVPVSADASLARLAEAFAREVAREARGRAVELSPTLDRTGRGASLALDFDELARARVGAFCKLSAYSVTGLRHTSLRMRVHAPTVTMSKATIEVATRRSIPVHAALQKAAIPQAMGAMIGTYMRCS